MLKQARSDRVKCTARERAREDVKLMALSLCSSSSRRQYFIGKRSLKVSGIGKSTLTIEMWKKEEIYIVHVEKESDIHITNIGKV